MSRERYMSDANRGIRILMILIIVFLAAIAVGLVLLFVLDFDKDTFRPTAEGFQDTLDIDEPDIAGEIQVDMLEELRGSDDLYSVLESWATNTSEHALMQSRDVINFLIVGIDAAAQNTDALILVSLNQTDHTVYLSSIMRDSYTYMDSFWGPETGKINATYKNGGIDRLVETVENNYKIRIDHYMTVEFKMFIKAVDTLGGVILPVEEYEMDEINRIADNENQEHLEEYGDAVLLDGTQALIYCRIRKCNADGDLSRTRRQRAFISALIDKSKSMTLAEAAQLIGTLHEYVRTDCSVTDLVELAANAFSDDWIHYTVEQATYPLEENRIDYNGYSWVWIVDYPADAVALQTMIYGSTNITLSEDRVTAIDLILEGSNGKAHP